MGAGIPLTDADREPWLEAIGERTREWDAAGLDGIVARSALRRMYRDRLAAERDVWFFHLTVTFEEARRRVVGGRVISCLQRWSSASSISLR